MSLDDLNDITTYDNADYAFLTEPKLWEYRSLGGILLHQPGGQHTHSPKEFGEIILRLCRDIEELHIRIDILKAKARHPD